jgi:heparan-alpha-glucosaminide N-acetyltransferase
VTGLTGDPLDTLLVARVGENGCDYMNTVVKTSIDTETSRATAQRIASIDIFRGLTMAVMIFVNALDGVRGLPWWTHHAHANWDVMTYVDMVFPFFLFAIGLSLPIAIERRLKRNPSTAALWMHVIVRSASLVVLGLILANAEKADPTLMGIKGSLWALLGIFCAALFLLDYSSLKLLQPYARVLQVIGIAGTIILYAIFRRTIAGHSAWIDFSYPEILGLIGFSYFAVSILYVPTRRWRWAPAMWFVVLVALCALSTDRMTLIHIRWPLYIWPFNNGSMGCIIMAGVVTTMFFRKPNAEVHSQTAIIRALAFAAIALGAGWALKPLGISKIRATPTWSLWSVGAAVILFVVLYWICDVKQWKRWAAPVHSAGANTLTTYLLPDIWDFALAALGLFFYEKIFPYGWPGVIKTVGFTCMILAISTLLTRARIRLQL